MHRARNLLVRQRTQLINAIRAHLAEFGLIQTRGTANVVHPLGDMRGDASVPEPAKMVIETLAEQLSVANEQIGRIEVRIAVCHKANSMSQRLSRPLRECALPRSSLRRPSSMIAHRTGLSATMHYFGLGY